MDHWSDPIAIWIFDRLNLVIRMQNKYQLKAKHTNSVKVKTIRFYEIKLYLHLAKSLTVVVINGAVNRKFCQ